MCHFLHKSLLHVCAAVLSLWEKGNLFPVVCNWRRQISSTGVCPQHLLRTITCRSAFSRRRNCLWTFVTIINRWPSFWKRFELCPAWDAVQISWLQLRLKYCTLSEVELVGKRSMASGWFVIFKKKKKKKGFIWLNTFHKSNLLFPLFTYRPTCSPSAHCDNGLMWWQLTQMCQHIGLLFSREEIARWLDYEALLYIQYNDRTDASRLTISTKTTWKHVSNVPITASVCQIASWPTSPGWLAKLTWRRWNSRCRCCLTLPWPGWMGLFEKGWQTLDVGCKTVYGG